MTPGRRIILGALGCGPIAALYFYDPAETAIYPPCPIHFLTGLYCPGCGALRALHRLMHADLAGAMSMNPLMVCSIPILALLVLRPAWAGKAWVHWVALGALVGFGVARNIPSWPFVLLAPH
jgi:hypothetical protein